MYLEHQQPTYVLKKRIRKEREGDIEPRQADVETDLASELVKS